MKLLLLFFLALPGYADKMEVHRDTMKSIFDDLDKYEKRMNELKALKSETGDGATLDAIVSEIADIHKKLLDVRKRKTLLADHLKLAHPGTDLISEMAMRRSPEEKKPALPGGAKGKTALKVNEKNDNLEQRLDALLKQVQSQYARTAKDREIKMSAKDETMVIDVEREKRKRQILQEDKDKYLQETMRSKIKVDAPAAAEETH